MRLSIESPEAIPANHAACWSRIRAHLGSRDGQLDLAAILVRKFRWSSGYAEAAVEEYRRFCLLAACCGHAVSPSAEVDEVWHLHLQYTRDYWETFCPQVLRMSLHHEPGGRSRAQDRQFRDQYADTLASYQRFFGPPPEAFWPGNAKRFGAPPRFRAVDTERVLVLPRPGLSQRRIATVVAAAVLTVLMLGVAPAAFALPLNPLDWDGAAFLKLYVALCAAGLVAAVALDRMSAGHGAASTVSLSPYEAAYLAGGAPRVLDAAVTNLMARGVAQWEPASGTVQITGSTRDLPAPLGAIAQQLRTTPDPVRAARTVDSVLGTLRQHLLLRGLLRDDGSARSHARLAAMPLLLVSGLGAAKIVIGLMRDRPVGFLVVLSVLMLIAGVMFLRRRSHITPAGKKTLTHTRMAHAAARAPRHQDVAIAVALFGTAVLAGTAYAGYHQGRHPSGDSGASGDSGSTASDSNSSSSDSGGDSGGSSGCGGCGGGGGGD